MSDNPFDDGERTVIRPVPGGGRRSPLPPASDQTLPQPIQGGVQSPLHNRESSGPASIFTGDEEPIRFGLNPLVSAAAPFLALMSRLARTFSAPNAADLRARTLQQIRAFERDAEAAGLPRDLIVKARFVLCASLDDIAQNTEWGRDGEWASRPLVAGFQEGVRGYEGIQSGVQFFQLLDEAKRRPDREVSLLELMYLCLSLGFLGELRVNPRPLAELDRVRESVYAVISSQRQAPAATLSPHWQGQIAPYRPPRAVLPVWVVGSAALALLGGIFVWVSLSLNDASDAVAEQMQAAPLGHLPRIVRSHPVLPPVALPSVPQQPDRLAVLLQPEIERGLVSLSGDPTRPIIRIRNLFASGSATVPSQDIPLLQRIGQALLAEPGQFEVGGYTDNKPIRTVRFPSNFQLSTARAEAVASVVAQALKQPDRISAKGHADADPIGTDEENRRIEIVLHRQG